MVEKSTPVQVLVSPVHTFCVFQGRNYEMSMGEMAVLRTSPMQRLKGLRQIGLGYLALPGAEHSRLVHSLGTAYWAVKFLEYLRSNGFADSVGDGHHPPGNRQRLEELDEKLGSDLSLDLIVRLFALVHDMTLLPLGHTLEFQLGYFKNEEVKARRAQCCLQSIQQELKPALQSVFPGGDVSPSRLYDCLVAHLGIIHEIFKFRSESEGSKKNTGVRRVAKVPTPIAGALIPLVIDLIASTFSADLVDFSLRDSLGVGTPRTFDESIGGHFCVFAQPGETNGQPFKKSGRHGNFRRRFPEKIYRFGLNPLVGEIYRHDVVTEVISLQRIRYELAERVFYHEEKLVADAMLDRVIRSIDEVTHAVSLESGPFSQERLLRMGDDEFLKLLETKEKQALKVGRKQRKAFRTVQAVMPDLLTRRLYKEAFRVSRQSDLSSGGLRLIKKAMDPTGRTDLEQKILRRIPELTDGDLIVSSRPLSMQAKPSSVLIGWTDGKPAPLMDIARKFGYAGEVLELADRYRSLWSLSVYLRPDAYSFASKIKQFCQALLEG